ncbi:MAG: J domain-containing protein [Bauldia sp.]|nr:J domain-containing protein [Bauldia sp.]
MAEAFPLAWPAGWPRTRRRQRARFDTTIAKARDELSAEIVRLGGRYPVLSSNLELRLNGLPRSSQREPDDPGVAVYFERGGKQMVFACDRWDRAQDNIRAITKTIEAIRGIERWGASELMERAFSAFSALPPPRSPWDILGVPRGSSAEAVKAAFRAKAAAAHPDTGGSTAAMAELNAARDAALREISS